MSVRGILPETPHVKISERDGEQTEHSLAQVRVTELRRGENWQPAARRNHGHDARHARRKISLPGSRWKFPASSPGHRRRWPKDCLTTAIILQTRGIYYQLKTDSTNDWQLRADV